MRWLKILFLIVGLNLQLSAQINFHQKFNSLIALRLDSGVNLIIDEPSELKPTNQTKIILYALPNGNTTSQTFGKQLAAGDDWHYNIQHIGAQTEFIRNADANTNYIVVYAENSLKSWPAWRKKFAKADEQIANIVADILKRYQKLKPKIVLSGHSGGGSFIFGFINSQNQIPSYIERIGFLDATYGYETEKHQAKLKNWLNTNNKFLQVIAYNDSVVVYNGKPLVSPTGGTWYRSQLMAKDLSVDFDLKKTDLPDRLNWNNKNENVAFTLIKNPDAKIFHTVLVEKNGFIDLVFRGTAYQDKNYNFWGDRVYENYILK
jgi:hypothetical protein